VAKAVKQESTQQGRGQARTRLARRAVVDAARTLFLERGYAATTVEAISTLADVPPATVYRLFSSKLGILKALLDTSIAGDDRPVPVDKRPDVASLFAERDPVKLLAGFTGVTSAINQRTNDLYRVLIGAADSEPAAADLLHDIEEQRRRGQKQIAHALKRNGSLRQGVSEHDAADVIHTLMSPELYRLFVVDRRWRPEKYERWLAATLVQQLT